MSGRELIVLIWGVEVGRVRCDKHGRLSLSYAEEWRRRDDAVPLSLSMPLGAAEHGHKPIYSYISGLLPDNEFVLQRWAQTFQVSARNPFALIANVGEDCAGAVQFVRPERMSDVAGNGSIEVEWLTEEMVADRLRALRQDRGAWRSPRDTGQFSLAGAQPKTAFYMHEDRVGVPAGRTPTTHILKPPLRDFPGHVENEHFCLALAREVGLPAAMSEVRSFAGELTIVVARYDRIRTADMAAQAAARAAASAGAAPDDEGGAAAVAEVAALAARASELGELAKLRPILRIHQEDMCQALSLPPTRKYENEGGPTAPQAIDLLRSYSTRPADDVSTFIDALAFNWLIAGTDAHAKNYSLLHSAGGRVRLAPLYDVASALPYSGLEQSKLRLAMRIGSRYGLLQIAERHWRDLARIAALDATTVVDRVRELASHIIERLPVLESRLIQDGLDVEIASRIAACLKEHIDRCQRTLNGR